MMMAENSTFEGASWLAYVNPATFELTAGDGSKKVYYKLRNVSLNESATKEDTIILDVTPPTSPEVLTAALTPEVSPTGIYMTWEAGTDVTSGVLGYNLYRSNSPGSGYVKYLALLTARTTTDASVSLGTDYYYYVKTEDKASNESIASMKASVPLLTLTRESQVTAPVSGGFKGGASDAVPGATIKYIIYITSKGFSAAQNVTVVDKVPAYANYKMNTATGEAISIVSYSNNNGSTYTYTPSGTYIDPAVTNIKWRCLDITSGATRKVEFSVVIR